MPRKKSGPPKRQTHSGEKQQTESVNAPKEPSNPMNVVPTGQAKVGGENSSGVPVAQLLQRIAELEQHERRKQFAQLTSTPNTVMSIFNDMKRQLVTTLLTSSIPEKELVDTKAVNSNTITPNVNASDNTITTTNSNTKSNENAIDKEPTNSIDTLKLQEITDYVNGVNEMFYDLVGNETTLRQHNQVLAEKNVTLSNLCRTLQNENKQLNANLKLMQIKEKEWRENIQKKFDESLENIRKQMEEHHTKYVKLIQENEVYRIKIDELEEFEKKRTTDYENYKSHASQLDKLQETEKINMRNAVESCKQEIKNLTKKLTRSLEENSQLEKKCKGYETKFGEMAKKMQSNADSINQFKDMKTKVIQENNDLHQDLKDLMAKYTQSNTYNDMLQQSLRAGNRKADLLQRLCRSLQQQNNVIKERMKSNGIDYQTVLQNIVYSTQINNPPATSSSSQENASTNPQLDTNTTAPTNVEASTDSVKATNANADVNASVSNNTSTTDKASGDVVAVAATTTSSVEEKQEEKDPSHVEKETTQSDSHNNKSISEATQSSETNQNTADKVQQQSEQITSVVE